MNHWPFIVAAYAVTILGTGAVSLWAFRAMRRAEALVEHLKDRA